MTAEMDNLTTEEKRAELESRGGAAEHRAWLLQSIAGEFRRREGMTEHTDYESVERVIAEARQAHRAGYGRELDDREVAHIRKLAELRSRVVTGGVGATDSWSLAKVHNWGVSVAPRQPLPSRVLANGVWEEVPL